MSKICFAGGIPSNSPKWTRMRARSESESRSPCVTTTTGLSSVRKIGKVQPLLPNNYWFCSPCITTCYVLFPMKINSKHHTVTTIKRPTVWSRQTIQAKNVFTIVLGSIRQVLAFPTEYISFLIRLQQS